MTTRWNIGLDIEKKTIEVITQRGIRMVTNPTLSHIFFTNIRQLRYWLLNTNMFTDTFFYIVKSKQGNTCSQIYCNYLRWKQIHLIKSNPEAHHSLSTLYTRYGVPSVMVMDNAMEKTAGELIKKRGMQISISAQLKILSPWMN